MKSIEQIVEDNRPKLRKRARPKIKIRRGGYDPTNPTADPTLESWEQVARDAVNLLSSISVTENISLHRSAIAKIARRIAILDGQLEFKL